MDMWEANLELIKKQQDRWLSMRSMPHNCDKFMTDIIMDKVRKVTGCTLAYGDLWVHSCETLETAKNNGTHEGYVAFGPCSRQGEIAMNNYKDALALNPDI